MSDRGQAAEKAEYAVKVPCKKGMKAPARAFESMSEMLKSLHALDCDATKSVEITIRPQQMLARVELSSLIAWVYNDLLAEDESIFSHPAWREDAVLFMDRTRLHVIGFMAERDTVSSPQEVIQLQTAIVREAERSHLLRIAAYQPPSPSALLKRVSSIACAARLLPSETPPFIVQPDTPDIQVPTSFAITDEQMDEIITREKHTSEGTMLLKVKKPDYLGRSQWEFRHEGSPFFATILHEEWLARFQRREVELRPGDALRVRVRTTLRYDDRNELIGKHNDVLNVENIIPAERGIQGEMDI